jgi:hypothetical protein
MGRGELGDFLADGGAVVGGGAAMGTVLGYLFGSVVHEFRPSTDPDAWARKGGLGGGVAGLIFLINGL